MFDQPAADSPAQAAGSAQPTAEPHVGSGPARVVYEGVVVQDAVDILRSGLAGLVSGLDPDVVVAQHAPDLWAGFARIERLASAGMTLLARRVEESTCWKNVGMRSAVEYLAQRSGHSRQAAGEALAASKQLPDLPQIDTALRKGGLSAAQAYLVADAAGEDPAAQQRLLDAARTCGIKELRDECGRVKAAADPDPEATRRRQKAGRRLRQFTDSEGFWHTHAKGHPDVAGVFNAALDPIIDELFHRARADGRQETREALAFDAYIEMARRAYAASYGYNTDEDESGRTADDGQEDKDDDDIDSATGRDDSGGAQARLPGQDDGVGLPNRAERRAHRRKRRTKSKRKKQSDPTHLPVLRLDLEALHRGHVQGHELCEIAGIGAISIDGAHERLGESVVKLVISAGGDIVSVTHLGQGPRAALRLGVQRSSLSEHARQPTHLALLHVDIDAIHRRARPGDALCTIAGVGPVSIPAAGEVLGLDLLDVVCRRSVPVAQLVHRGRKPTVAQRTALLWTQPTCTVAGCPHSFTEIDHRQDWAKTYRTRLDALDRLCPHHHRLKTHHDWALVPGTGKRAFVPPDDPRHPKGRRATTDPAFTHQTSTSIETNPPALPELATPGIHASKSGRRQLVAA